MRLPNLRLLIAHHARVRRAPGVVFLGEIIDDLLLEFLRFVHQVVRNAQFVRNSSGIHHGLGPAAFVLRSGDTILRPEFQRDANDVVALLHSKAAAAEESTPPLMPTTTRVFVFCAVTTEDAR